MRKVYVEVKARIIMNMDDGVEVDDVICNMDYHFTPNTEGVDFVDEEIRDYEVTDSKQRSDEMKKDIDKPSCKGRLYDGHTKGNAITVPCCHPLSETLEFWSDTSDYSCKVIVKTS